MIKKLIEDDVEARAIADAYGVSEGMIAQGAAQLPESIATGTAVSILAKRAAPVEDIKGPFEFVVIVYFVGFDEGENGWSVVRWSDVSWEELPQVAIEMLKVEQELLPLAVDPDFKAKAKIEEYRKKNRES